MTVPGEGTTTANEPEGWQPANHNAALFLDAMATGHAAHYAYMGGVLTHSPVYKDPELYRAFYRDYYERQGLELRGTVPYASEYGPDVLKQIVALVDRELNQ